MKDKMITKRWVSNHLNIQRIKKPNSSVKSRESVWVEMDFNDIEIRIARILKDTVNDSE